MSVTLVIHFHKPVHQLPPPLLARFLAEFSKRCRTTKTKKRALRLLLSDLTVAVFSYHTILSLMPFCITQLRCRSTKHQDTCFALFSFDLENYVYMYCSDVILLPKVAYIGIISGKKLRHGFIAFGDISIALLLLNILCRVRTLLSEPAICAHVSCAGQINSTHGRR